MIQKGKTSRRRRRSKPAMGRRRMRAGLMQQQPRVLRRVTSRVSLGSYSRRANGARQAGRQREPNANGFVL